MIEKGDHRIEEWRLCDAESVRLAEPPTAVMTSTHDGNRALGTIHDAGLQVPRDVSLIGFADISFWPT